MEKEQKDENSSSGSAEVDSDQRLDLNGLPLPDDVKQIFHVFQGSVDKLESQDRAAVVEHFEKLRDAMSLLGKSVDKILSSEEGRQLFEQEMKKKQGT